MANFASDNNAGVSPEILKAIEGANDSHAKAYGADEWSNRLTPAFRAFFENKDLLVFPVFNGSGSNCTALASLMRPYEAVIAHDQSHIQRDECGMPEFFTGGKVLAISGANGKLQPSAVSELIEHAKASGVHHVHPKTISITQSTEFGTVYTVDEIKGLSSLAKKEGLYLHMDGARFANAVASLGCKAGDLSWRAGVDVLSFGCTKNGALLAEAVVFFRPELATDFGYVRKRAGQLASKQRYLSAQLLAMIDNNLWLKNAIHANDAAKDLAAALKKIPEMQILNLVEANAVFVKMPKSMAENLFSKGHYFYSWPLADADAYRLVTSFQTNADDIKSFVKDCQA